MLHSRTRLAAFVGALGTVLSLSAVALGDSETSARDRDRPPGLERHGAYEVWTADQADTRAGAPGYGGKLHIYDGRKLERDAARAKPKTIDLGGKASDLCKQRTGAYPTRPHMIVFNGAERLGEATDAAIAFVVSGHVLFMDTETRKPIDCIRTTPGAPDANGKPTQQAHAAWPTPDQKHLIVANQNGKKLERIRTDYANDEFVLEKDATLSLYEGTTPSGRPKQDPSTRPDNAPICPRTTEDGRLTFVTLRGGGMFVVDHNTQGAPMRIVAEYDRHQVDDNGCGEFQAGDKMYVNSGAGAPGDPDGHDVYSFDLDKFGSKPNPPNTPEAKLVYTRAGDVDAHAVSNSDQGSRYLWWGDRTQNDVTVVDTRDDEVVNRFSLVGDFATDPAPDLFDLSPNGEYMFASLRGPAPLSGGHDAIGNSPGVGVIEVRRGGTHGGLVGVAPAPAAVLRGVQPDPHGIRVRLKSR